jgi:hypothetical protein
MQDPKGRTYFEFPESMALPMERFLKQKEFMEWMMSGLTDTQLRMLSEQAHKSMVDGLSLPAKSAAQAKEFAKAMSIISQISERQDKVIPMDLVINCLCAQLIREDENPHVWNQDIHQEKCDFFKAHHMDYQFFFRFTAFRKLSKTLNVSKENWNEYLLQQALQAQAVTESLKMFSSRRESSKEESKT